MLKDLWCSFGSRIKLNKKIQDLIADINKHNDRGSKAHQCY